MLVWGSVNILHDLSLPCCRHSQGMRYLGSCSMVCVLHSMGPKSWVTLNPSPLISCSRAPIERLAKGAFYSFQPSPEVTAASSRLTLKPKLDPPFGSPFYCGRVYVWMSYKGCYRVPYVTSIKTSLWGCCEPVATTNKVML